MGVIMPIYTVGIIIFFMYTTMKVNPFRDCERTGVREHLFGRGGGTFCPLDSSDTPS